MSYEAVAGDSLPGSLPRQFEASGESVKRAGQYVFSLTIVPMSK